MEPITLISLVTSYNIYIIVMSIFLLLDNKETSSTFAWLFLIAFFPIVGVLLYFLFGRNLRKKNKKEKREHRRILEMMHRPLLNLIITQPSKRIHVKKLLKHNDTKRLMNLLYKNSDSLLTTANEVNVIQSGEEKFKLLLEDIRKAKSFIHFEYFIWKNDAFTMKLRDILMEKLKEGVEVRILGDALGCFFLKKHYYRRLIKAGAKVKASGDLLYPSKIHTLNYRNHRKIVVIDGKIGYTGGMNLGEEYSTGGRRFKSWRDTHLRLKGESVGVLQGLFALDWYMAAEEELFDEKYYKYYRLNQSVPLQITTSGPDSEWDSIRQLYLALIASAQEKVYIQSPYFVPDQSLLSFLTTAALGGLDIRLMITGIPDKKIPYWAAYTYFRELLKAGVKIYHYKKGFLHSKTVIVDNEVCTIGTANLDIRSFLLNYELNTLIYDKKITEALEEAFFEDMRHCSQFTLEDYKRLSIFAKLRNSIAKLLAPLL